MWCYKNIKLSEIYTVGSRDVTWRSIGEVPYRFCGYMSMVFVEGVLHAPYGQQVVASEEDCILCFDVKSEHFQLLPGPAKPRYHQGSITENVFGIIKLGGCLCCVDFFPDDLVIWMMTEYGVKESWTKKYVFPGQQDPLKEGDVLHTHILFPWSLMKQGELLFYLQYFHDSDSQANYWRYHGYYSSPHYLICQASSLALKDTHSQMYYLLQLINEKHI
ncbi:F-box protein At3g07870-like [Tripterygium wilfordii]|uniref:F-box protein At3g07870-like n=1 Tax=Tripterygium wilfordii TaxID=458696 RepID=UPI0018F851D7|nr:F-box protein At3g07870-like [Tripterygium wilfordii]